MLSAISSGVLAPMSAPTGPLIEDTNFSSVPRARSPAASPLCRWLSPRRPTYLSLNPERAWRTSTSLPLCVRTITESVSENLNPATSYRGSSIIPFRSPSPRGMGSITTTSKSSIFPIPTSASSSLSIAPWPMSTILSCALVKVDRRLPHLSIYLRGQRSGPQPRVGSSLTAGAERHLNRQRGGFLVLDLEDDLLVSLMVQVDGDAL